MHGSTAYKVRRARDKDKIACQSQNPVSAEALDRFEGTYQCFAAIKGLAPLDRASLDQPAKDGCLELSVAQDAAGEALAYHVYYHDASRSGLLHAASLYQTLADSAVAMRWAGLIATFTGVIYFAIRSKV